MSRVKAPTARTPLRGRGRTLEVPAAPVDQAHGALLRQLRAAGCPPLLLVAATDATWLRPADGPALAVAGMILEQLGRGRAALEVDVPTDEVGTVAAFPDLGGAAGSQRPGTGAQDGSGAAPLRSLMTVLVGLLGDLGMTPEARARLGILLVEGGSEPEVPAPARLPRSARDRAPSAA